MNEELFGACSTPLGVRTHADLSGRLGYGLSTKEVTRLSYQCRQWRTEPQQGCLPPYVKDVPRSTESRGSSRPSQSSQREQVAAADGSDFDHYSSTRGPPSSDSLWDLWTL